MPKKYDHDDEVTAEIDPEEFEADPEATDVVEPTQILSAPPKARVAPKAPPRPKAPARPSAPPQNIPIEPTEPPPPVKKSAPKIKQPPPGRGPKAHPSFQWDAPQATIGQPHNPNPTPSNPSPVPQKQYYFEEPRGSRVFNVYTFLAMLVGGIIATVTTVFLVRPNSLAQIINTIKGNPAISTPAAPPAKTTLVTPPIIATPVATPTLVPTSTPTPVAEVTPPKPTPTAAPVRKVAVKTPAPKAEKPLPKPAPVREDNFKGPKLYIKDIVITPSPAFVRVGVNTDGHPFTFTQNTFNDPFRLVVDIQGLNGTYTAPKIDATEGPLISLRVSRRTDNETRLVLDFVDGVIPKYVINRVDGGLSILIQKP